MTDQTKEKPTILFYCKDCEEIVETMKVGGKYVYKCKKCGTKNVAFGTQKSIYGFFKLKDKEEEEEEVVKKEPLEDAKIGEETEAVDAAVENSKGEN